MEVKQIQNEKRYTHKGKGWVVSSIGDSPNGNRGGEIHPFDIPKGEDILMEDLKPLLEVDGIIVKVNSYYLISQTTLDDILKSDNPHWDYQQNGSVLKRPIGKTIPIINISIDKLVQSGDAQDKKILNAGVQSVDYLYETEMEMGVPLGLVKQINYTLSESTQRPGDTFSLWDMSLGDDTIYGINKLNIDTAQADGTLDKTKLNKFLSDVGVRLDTLRKDFNMIKKTFYNGDVPASKGKIEFKDRVASTESSNDMESPNKQVVIKETILTSSQPQPISTAVDSTTKKIESTTKTTQQQIDEQRAALASQQQKQTLAEQQLQADLNQYSQRTDEYYKQKYGGGAK